MPADDDLLFKYPAQSALAWARDEQAAQGYFDETELRLQPGVGPGTVKALRTGGFVADLKIDRVGWRCILTIAGLALIQTSIDV